jgi:IS5 family transposase
VSTPATQELPNLLHGNKTRLYGDCAYIGQKEVLKQIAATTKNFTNKRASRDRPLTDSDRETNRRKSQVRAKVEHPFRPLKSSYGFAKVRHRGPVKNANHFCNAGADQSRQMGTAFFLAFGASVSKIKGETPA